MAGCDLVDADLGSQSLLKGWHRRALSLSVLLSAGGYGLFTLWGGWGDVAEAIRRVTWLDVAVLLGLSLVNYGLRFLRWHGYLKRLRHPVPWGFNLHAYLTGFALTTTPGKAGEALRGVFLKPRGVPYTVSVGALFAERFADLITVVLLCLPGLWFYPPAQPWVIAALLGLPLLMWVLQREVWLARVEQRIVASRGGRLATLLTHTLHTVRQAGRLFAVGSMISALALGLVAWGAEALAFSYLLGQMGLAVPVSIAIFIYAFAMLVGALSFLPGGLGGAEVTMALLLVLNGATPAEAATATLVIRLATLWFAVAIGLGALLRPPRTGAQGL